MATCDHETAHGSRLPQKQLQEEEEASNETSHNLNRSRITVKLRSLTIPRQPKRDSYRTPHTIPAYEIVHVEINEKHKQHTVRHINLQRMTHVQLVSEETTQHIKR